jgi:uncharacterized protein (TIGR02466 family)
MHTALRLPTVQLPQVPAGGKFQTDQTLHQLVEFTEIVLFAANGVTDFLSAQHTSLMITDCWASIAAPGATHKAHTHPNNYLSGVYNLQADEGARHIRFDDPRMQTNIMNPPVSETTAQNAAQIHVGISDGMLVLFPAWLALSVGESQRSRSNQHRIQADVHSFRPGNGVAEVGR